MGTAGMATGARARKGMLHDRMHETPAVEVTGLLSTTAARRISGRRGRIGLYGQVARAAHGPIEGVLRR